jgi:hypothetical protein
MRTQVFLCLLAAFSACQLDLNAAWPADETKTAAPATLALVAQEPDMSVPKADGGLPTRLNEAKPLTKGRRHPS